MNDPDPTATPNRLTSALLVDDPEMVDIVEEFIDGLAGRIGDLRQAYQQLDWDRMTLLAHQLKGAGGSYGYPDLSAVGATMEKSFRNHSAAEFAAWMRQLAGLAAAARAGLEAPGE